MTITPSDGGSTSNDASLEAEDVDFVNSTKERRAATMTNRLPTLLYVNVTLFDNQRELEESWFRGLQKAANTVSGVLLNLPCWQEVPDAFEHKLTQTMIRAIKFAGLDLYIGRDGWVRWPSRVVNPAHAQSPNDPMNHMYWAIYLRTLAAEKLKVGAKGTFGDFEPYAESIFKEEWFKKTGFSENERARVLTAINDALEIAPPLDMAYPAGGQNPEHYGWTLRHLAREYVHGKPRYAQGPGDVHMTPPPGEEVGMHWWGSSVTAATALVESISTSEPGKALTVQEWLALDWNAIRSAYPELKGCWLYVGRGELLEVMEQLGET